MTTKVDDLWRNPHVQSLIERTYLPGYEPPVKESGLESVDEAKIEN